MDKSNTTQNGCNRQGTRLKSSPNSNRPVFLSQSDRRLLPSTLCLLLKRSRHGVPVTTADLLRLVPYADPDASPEAAKVAA